MDIDAQDWDDFGSVFLAQEVADQFAQDHAAPAASSEATTIQQDLANFPANLQAQPAQTTLSFHMEESALRAFAEKHGLRVKTHFSVELPEGTFKALVEGFDVPVVAGTSNVRDCSCFPSSPQPKHHHRQTVLLATNVPSGKFLEALLVVSLRPTYAYAKAASKSRARD